MGKARGQVSKPKEEAPGQLDLVADGLLGDGITDPTRPAPPAEYTGEQLKRSRPQTYDQAIKLIAAGLSTREIARLLQVGPMTISRLRDSSMSLSAEKERLGRLMRQAARLAVEGVLEDLLTKERADKISTRDKGLLASMLAEKGELLLGGATSRTEAASVAFSPEEFRRMFQGAAPSSTGSGAETPAQDGVTDSPGRMDACVPVAVEVQVEPVSVPAVAPLDHLLAPCVDSVSPANASVHAPCASTCDEGVRDA